MPAAHPGAPPAAGGPRVNPINVRSALELLMFQQIKTSGLEEGCERDYRFAMPERKWALDFAWPARRIALEVEGGTWVEGRHSRAQGFERDAEKYCEAAIAGWRVLRVTNHMVEDGRALGYLERLFERMGESRVAVG